MHTVYNIYEHTMYIVLCIQTVIILNNVYCIHIQCMCNTCTIRLCACHYVYIHGMTWSVPDNINM